MDEMAAEGSVNPLKANLRILAGGFLAFLSLTVLNSSYSTVMVLIKEELSLSYTMSGALMSSYFVGYAMGQIPWGLLADRYGSRRVMASSILGIACATLLFGRATVFWHAAVARFLSGLLGAGVFVPAVRLVSGWFPEESRGTALGLLSVGGSFGLVSASWLTPFATTQLGWRTTITVFGLLGIASSAGIYLTLRDKPRQASSPSTLQDIRELATTKSFWALALVQMVRLGSYYSFIAWLPLLLQEEFGLGLVAAGGVFSLFNLSGLVSNPLGGVFSDRLGERGVLAASFALLGLSAFSLTLVKSRISLYGSVIAIGWFINFVRSPSFAVIPRLYGVERAGKVSGLQNTFASFGALILPLFLGYVRDTTASYWAGWTVLSVLLFLVAGVSLLLAPRKGSSGAS
ncbi:MFS transporter [Candidatus Bathyarchaeota archaeon]|nr:MAG: MFS transporter [Candidatus Bathyarchaeota archaeon]